MGVVDAPGGGQGVDDGQASPVLAVGRRGAHAQVRCGGGGAVHPDTDVQTVAEGQEGDEERPVVLPHGGVQQGVVDGRGRDADQVQSPTQPVAGFPYRGELSGEPSEVRMSSAGHFRTSRRKRPPSAPMSHRLFLGYSNSPSTSKRSSRAARFTNRR